MTRQLRRAVTGCLSVLQVTSNMYNKSPYVQQVILSMLPRLAALDRNMFCDK